MTQYKVIKPGVVMIDGKTFTYVRGGVTITYQDGTKRHIKNSWYGQD